MQYFKDLIFLKSNGNSWQKTEIHLMRPIEVEIIKNMIIGESNGK